MPSTHSEKTKENTRYLFRALKAAYTHRFRSMYPSDEDLHVAMQLWTIKIASYTRDELDQALLDLVETCEWVPSLAEFLSELKKNRKRNELYAAANVVDVPKVNFSGASVVVDADEAQKNIARLKKLIAGAFDSN